MQARSSLVMYFSWGYRRQTVRRTSKSSSFFIRTKSSPNPFQETAGTTEPLAVLPLSIVEDCYNLRLEAPPLMLTRSAHDNKFQILWPERRDFAIEDHEFFEFLEGNRLYTTVWYEDPEYREEVLVRDYETGEVLERIPGSLRQMPDGQRWLLV